MRAFVRLRGMLSSHKDLERKLIALEKKYDEQSKVVFDAIRALMKETEKPKRRIGFEVKEPKAKYGKRWTENRRRNEITDDRILT